MQAICNAQCIEVSNLIIVGYLRPVLDTVTSILTIAGPLSYPLNRRSNVLIAICLIAVFDRGSNITTAGPVTSLLDRRSNVLAGHVTPVCHSRSFAAVAVPERCFLNGCNGHPGQPD